MLLGYAMAKRWRKPGFNCATWKDNLEHLLLDPRAIHKPEPHASLRREEIAGFMRVLRAMDGMGLRCRRRDHPERVADERSHWRTLA